MQSRYWQHTFTWDLTEAPAEASVAWLLGRAQDIGRSPILIPTNDFGCLFVADHVAALGEAFLFPHLPPGLARALSNKQQMYLLCKEHDIPTAETLFPQSRADVEAFIPTATFPVMLKGIDTAALSRRTGVSMVMIDDAETLLRRYDELETPDTPSLMVQEYIPGGSEAVWMFNGYFDEDSRCLFGMTGRKIRQYPAYKGVTSLGVCVDNEAVRTETIAFMRSIGYRGILDIGYKYDSRTGEYKLLDVNPRVGATFRLFVDRAGTDVVRALYRDLTGQPIPASSAAEGRKWMMEPFDLLASVAYLRDGNMSPREWVGSFRGLQEGSWFARDDLRPFGSVWWQSVRSVRERLSREA